MKNQELNQNFKKTIEFIDADKHKAIVSLEITDRNGYQEFASSGLYLNTAGQCLDNIKPKTQAQKDLLALCNKYHLNDREEALPANFSEDLKRIIHLIELEEAANFNSAPIKSEGEKLAELMEEFGIDTDLEDACKAYLDITDAEDLRDFEESYAGEFNGDEEFAQDLAENVGAIDKNAIWPNNCIDWEKAAREIMFDYSEQDGFYFRNL